MNDYNYNFEIAKNLKMLEHALDDIEVRRYEDMTGKMTDRIKVNFIYGPKGRIIQDMLSKGDTVKLPIIAMTTTGMNRADDRNKNKIEDIIYTNADGGFSNIRAIPWNINVQLTILSKYQQDMEQIIQNFSVFMNPYLIYSIQEPKSKRELRVEVGWDGQVAMDYPTVGGDLPHNMPFRLTATVNFTIKTWLFRAAITPVKPICFIYDKIVVTDMFSCDYENMLNDNVNNLTESYSLSGQPQLRYVDKYYFKTRDSPKITISGDGFKGTTSLFVSGSDTLMYPMSAYDAPDGSRFNGYPIKEFSIPNTQTLSFNLPPAASIGFVDIIAINDCGWSKLTVDANRCGRVENPYPANLPEHYSWCVQQFPYLNGLIISNNLNDGVDIDIDKDIIVIDDELIDKDAILAKIKELITLGQITPDDLAHIL